METKRRRTGLLDPFQRCCKPLQRMLTLVLPGEQLEAKGVQDFSDRLWGREEADFAGFRPRHGIVRCPAVSLKDIVEQQTAPRLEHPRDLAIKRTLVGNVHLNML